jgi:hypothetical protein
MLVPDDMLLHVDLIIDVDHLEELPRRPEHDVLLHAHVLRHHHVHVLLHHRVLLRPLLPPREQEEPHEEAEQEKPREWNHHCYDDDVLC